LFHLVAGSETSLKILIIDGLRPFEAKHGASFIRAGDFSLELVGESNDLLDQLRVGRQDATPHVNIVLQAERTWPPIMIAIAAMRRFEALL
jgi:hypothetical protein